jgi:hypothetical protein
MRQWIWVALVTVGRSPWEGWDDSNVDYNARFTFSRIRYGGGGWFGNASWAHDYPRADLHVPKILEELTTIEPNLERSNVFDLDDPEIFRHPVIYVSEPGFWRMADSHVQKLRDYMLKGGFVIFDDFEAAQWYNFEAQVRRSLPEYQMVEIDPTHPIFHSFFEVTEIYFPHPMVQVTPVYFGVFENNDPSKRMMAMVNFNNDLAEYWEWSDTGMFPVDITNEAYKLAVNYIVYSMTH